MRSFSALLSIAFAALFAEIVTRIERVTEGELMATNGQLALARTIAGGLTLVRAR